MELKFALLINSVLPSPAQKINSSISLIESNESGRFDAGNALINPQGQAGKNLQTQ